MKKQNLLFGMVISAVLALIALSIKASHLEEIDWALMLPTVLYNFLYGLMCWLLAYYLINRGETFNFKRNSVFFGVLGITTSALMLFVFDWIYSSFFPNTLQFQNTYGVRLYINIFLRGIIISSLYYFFNLYIVVLKDKQEHQLEIERLKQAQLEANISSLKEQLSPHFLFNTLNTLSTLTSDKTVKDFVSQLANVYRYVLVNKTNDTTTLHEELEFTRAYLHILQMRHEDALIINVNIDEQLENARIAPFSLQLLVENAMKHNIASLSKPLHISISNDKNDFIVIENNLQEKIAAHNSTGIGLANIMERYRYLFQKEIEIIKTTETFTVKLPVTI